jgi:hypothetical protein
MNYKETLVSLGLNENELSQNAKIKIKKIESLKSNLDALESSLRLADDEEKVQQEQSIEQLKIQIDALDKKLSRSFGLWIKNKEKYIAISKNIRGNNEKDADDEAEEVEDAEIVEQKSNSKNKAVSKLDELYGKKVQKFKDDDLNKDDEYEEKNTPKPKSKINWKMLGWGSISLGVALITFGAVNLYKNKR